MFADFPASECGSSDIALAMARHCDTRVPRTDRSTSAAEADRSTSGPRTDHAHISGGVVLSPSRDGIFVLYIYIY